MTRNISRFLIALFAVACLALGNTAHAQSLTGPWQWTDLSDKLSVRDNRPVWSVVRAEPYWYMTDGQELWSGGHVWKTDGSTVTDITLDVRNAGMSRVDDMVSDGQNVLFLKGVTRQDNQFEVVSYNGSFTNRTSLLRGYLNSNEGLSSVNGKNGIWMTVTAQNRVFSWNMGSNTLSQISLPLTPNNNYNQPYSVRHVSPADGQSVFTAVQAVPTSGGWIFTIPQNSSPYVRTYFYQNSYFNEVSLGLNNVQFIASNGSQVIIKGDQASGSYYGNYGFVVLDGSTIKNQGSSYNTPSIDWTKATASYNGKSWLIISNKNLIRFDGSSFQTYGQTNDMFLTVSGNGNGTFLLGGVLSTAGNSSPTSPLTAKLVRVDEGTGYVAPTTVTSGNGVSSDEKIAGAKGYKNRINYNVWFDPNWALHDNVTDPKYTVVGQSNDGLRRIELYINGVRQKVCDGKDSKKNVTCAMYIESTAYSYDNDVAVNAKLTSTKGLVTWVPIRNIQFHNGNVDHSDNGNTGNDGPVTANMSVSNSAHTLTRGTNVTVTANASAPAGLSRMDLYVNGAVKNTCSVSGTYNTCNFTLTTSDYPNGSTISFNVRAVDVNGRDGWTWLGSYDITDQYVNNNSGDVTANLYVDSWSGTGSGSSAYVKAQGYSPNGLNRLDLYANGSLYRTCTYSQAYGTQTCAVSAWASSFPYTSTVPVYVIATDANGRQATSNTVTLNFNNNTSNGGGTNNSGNTSVWFGADVTNNQELRRDLTKTVTVYGQSVNGLNKLEIYANDNLVQQCTFGNVANSTQTCQATIYGSSYSDGSSVYLKARATDAYGNTAWTSGTLYLRITSNGTGNGNASVYFTTSPNDSNWNRNTSRYITAYGSDSDGLRRLEIFMRGVNYKSCEFGDVYGTQSCAVTVNGYDNTAGSNVEINVRATDKYGNVTWASSQYYLMTNDGGGNQNGTASLTVSPDKTTYGNTDTVQIYASGSDNDGVKRIDVYANGSIINTCTAPQWNTSYSCSASAYLGNYTAGTSQLPIQVKLTDTNENAVWSSTKYLTITGYQNPGAMTFTVSPDKTSYTANETVTVNMGWTVNDITRMEIYANNNLIQTCNNPSGYAPSCSTTLSTSAYANTNVSLQGKFISSGGSVNWTNTRTITVAGTQQQTDQPGSITISTDANGGYTTNQNVTFTANGSDPNGIGRIEILVNAQLAKTCTGAATCSFTGGPYSTNSVSYGANLYDSLGNRTWTGYQSIYKK